jgi:hypothetical protein
MCNIPEHWRWDCDLAQSLWKSLWRFFKNMNKYKQGISFLGILSKGNINHYSFRIIFISI